MIGKATILILRSKPKPVGMVGKALLLVPGRRVSLAPSQDGIHLALEKRCSIIIPPLLGRCYSTSVSSAFLAPWRLVAPPDKASL
jgi:hypothetical protein